MIFPGSSKDCCGCMACVDICLLNCISQTTDKDGYIRPIVDEKQCVDCHQCEKVCPELNPVHIDFDGRKLYSAYHKDDGIRSQGSSGSAFAALAQIVFSKNGVVYGAAFDSNLQLMHRKAENMEALKPLMRSKYLQSNTKGIYSDVKKQLKSGRIVLFVGTPCQTNAVHNFINPKLRTNLLLVDFICHGVPSQSLFNKSLKYFEKKKKVIIQNVSFRTKYKGYYHSFELKYIDKNGNHFIKKGPYTEFPFYRAFKKYITFRDSCYHCRHTGVARASDITIGDFWGLRSISPDVSDDDFSKGFSEIIINSPKGLSLVEELKEYMVLKPFDANLAGNSNPSYMKCVKEGKRKMLFRLFNRFLPYSITEKLLFR